MTRYRIEGHKRSFKTIRTMFNSSKKRNPHYQASDDGGQTWRELDSYEFSQVVQMILNQGISRVR